MIPHAQATRSNSLGAAVAGLKHLRETQADLSNQAYLLHSLAHHTAWCGLGARRVITYTRDGYRVTENGQTQSIEASADIFRGLQNLLNPDMPAFFLVSLDLHRPACDADLPLIIFIQPEAELVFHNNSSDFEILTTHNELADRIRRELSNIPRSIPPSVDIGIQSAENHRPFHGEDDAHFLDRLARAIETLQSVDGKMILTRTYRKTCAADLDPYRLYEIYSAMESGACASHYASFGDDFHSIGCSPENVFELSGGRLCFDVIAGTRGISTDPAEDARWLHELKSDPKEHKEHNMALERYHRRIASLCSPQSVTMDRYMDVRTLRHVRHLFSRVSGELQPPTDFLDLLRGSSPPLCSYPAELIPLADPGIEPTRFYGGMVGRISPGWQDAQCFLNLRAALIKGTELYTQGGVGVIRESIARQEMLEVSNKLRSLKEAIAVWENHSNR